MAKHKNKKSGGSNRGQSNRDSSRGFASDVEDTDLDTDTSMEMSQDNDTSMSGTSMPGSSMSSNRTNRTASLGQEGGLENMDPKQLFDRFRDYIEGHPGRATLLGAAVGGLAAGLCSTDMGRGLLRASYSYARPMISDLAQKFVTNQSSAAIESTLPQ